MTTPIIEQLTPAPKVNFDCPTCDIQLNATGWCVPGMRVLVEIECPSCGREYYGDVQTGDAWDDPVLLDASSGETVTARDDFFSTWLRESYANRHKTALSVDFDSITDLKRPALLNCLDQIYGHSLLKLLNVQYILDETDVDPVVLVPSNLKWLVPDAVPAVWSVDFPHSSGNGWNDWLADQIETEVGPFDAFGVCRVPPHPPLDAFAIDRFTGVKPYDKSARIDEPTQITYVWRDDRHWSPVPPTDITLDWLDNKLSSKITLPETVDKFVGGLDVVGRKLQCHRVKKLARQLKKAIPNLQFTVGGIGSVGELPEWIDIVCYESPSVTNERELCHLYADSDLVVGVHGSNLLLPSAHAGGTIDLMPDRRWGNTTQDLLPNRNTAREILYNYQLLPLNTDPARVSDIVSQLITSR